MLEFLFAFFCTCMYLAFRPRRVKRMMCDGMCIEYPRFMNETLIREFPPFNEWQNNMRRGLVAMGANVEKVSVRDVYMFGSRVGFMLMDVSVNMYGVSLPGAVLLRGRSLAVLLWYREYVTNEMYVVLVRQPRVATGTMTWEVPAGMADGHGTLKGQMFKEIEEETGLALNVHQLTHHGDVSPFTSAGLVDETLELYSMQISPDVMNDGTRHEFGGNRSEGELIVNVAAVPLSDPRVREDGKLRILLSVVEA